MDIIALIYLVALVLAVIGIVLSEIRLIGGAAALIAVGLLVGAFG